MSEIREAYDLLTQIDRLLADIELKINRIEGQAPALERNLGSFRQLERLALRWLVLARHMGLPEDVDSAINKIAKLIVMLRMAQMSLNMLMMGNPVTAAIGFAGMMTTLVSASDVMAGY